LYCFLVRVFTQPSCLHPHQEVVVSGGGVGGGGGWGWGGSKVSVVVVVVKSQAYNQHWLKTVEL